MKKLFIVYQTIPIVVYADSINDAKISVLSNFMFGDKDPNNYPNNLIKEIRTEKDIPTGKEHAIPVNSKKQCTELLEEINKKKPKIVFEYCECGCHGSSCRMFGRTLSTLGIFGTGINKNEIIEWLLYDGHVSFGSEVIGHYKTHDDVALAAEKIFKQEAIKFKKQIALFESE